MNHLSTFSSHPPRARNTPVGCHATLRIPKPGFGKGLNEVKRSPDKVNTCNLNWKQGLKSPLVSGSEWSPPLGDLPRRQCGCPWGREKLRQVKRLVMESAAVTSFNAIFNKQRTKTTHSNQLILIRSFINAESIFGFVTFSKHKITSIRPKSVAFDRNQWLIIIERTSKPLSGYIGY
jgi:hypothetical protein